MASTHQTCCCGGGGGGGGGCCQNILISGSIPQEGGGAAAFVETLVWDGVSWKSGLWELKKDAGVWGIYYNGTRLFYCTTEPQPDCPPVDAGPYITDQMIYGDYGSLISMLCMD